MGLLGYLFGGKKGQVKRLKLSGAKLKAEEERRLRLWKEHMENYPKRKALADQFSPAKVDELLKNKNADKIIKETLKRLEELVDEELLTIKGEKREDIRLFLDSEKALKDGFGEIAKLNNQIINEKGKLEKLNELFKKIDHLLRLELYHIKHTRGIIPLQNVEWTVMPSTKDMLIKLYRLILQEGFHYRVFDSSNYLPQSVPVHAEVVQIGRALLLEQEWEEREETAEEKFVVEVLEKMGAVDSKHHLRVLGEDIFHELLFRVEAPFSSEEEIEAAKLKMEALADNEKAMVEIITKIVKRRKKKYTAAQIILLARAFRKAFEYGHFLDFEAGLYT